MGQSSVAPSASESPFSPDDATSVENLVKLADAAMYRAKQTRNAVARTQLDSSPTTEAPALPALELPARATSGSVITIVTPDQRNRFSTQ